jgi:hypothetical protein
MAVLTIIIIQFNSLLLMCPVNSSKASVIIIKIKLIKIIIIIIKLCFVSSSHIYSQQINL